MNEETIGVGQLLAGLWRTKRLWLIAAALTVGIFLMVWGNSETEKTIPAGSSGAAEHMASELEAKVSALCERAAGTSNVSVMITLESYGECEYAKNSHTDSDGDERLEYVTVSQGLVRTAEHPPRVRGIAVVLDGGDDPALRLRLTELLCALFQIPSGAVSIVGARS